jgi:hypothetical protein
MLPFAPHQNVVKMSKQNELLTCRKRFSLDFEQLGFEHVIRTKYVYFLIFFFFFFTSQVSVMMRPPSMGMGHILSSASAYLEVIEFKVPYSFLTLGPGRISSALFGILNWLQAALA